MFCRRLLCFGLALSLLIVLIPNAKASYTENPSITEGSIYYIAIGQPSTEGVPYQKHDKAYVEADFDFHRGDIYILKCNEVYKLRDGEPFKYVEGKENVTGKVRLEHIKEDDRYEVYCLAVDNSDSARPNDAVPNGTISVELEFDWDSRHQTIFMYKLIAIFLVITAIVVAVLVVYWKMNS